MDLAQLSPPPPHLTEVAVSKGGRLLGALHIADVLRPEAAQAVAGLNALGLRTILLTGDAAAIAARVGQELGVDEVVAEVLPDQKLDKIRLLRSEGRRVAMVGDGINDAPALAEADVGIAMGGGTEVARESAGVLLLGDNPHALVMAVKIARKCRGIILQNFWGTLVVDGVGMALAASACSTRCWPLSFTSRPSSRSS